MELQNQQIRIRLPEEFDANSIASSLSVEMDQPPVERVTDAPEFLPILGVSAVLGIVAIFKFRRDRKRDF